MSPFDNTNAVKHLTETWRHQVNYNTSQKLGFFVAFNHRQLQGVPRGSPPHPAGSACCWSTGRERVQCVWRESWLWCRAICSGGEQKALTGISTHREAAANPNSVLSGVRAQVTGLAGAAWVLGTLLAPSGCCGTFTVSQCPCQVTGSGFECP